MLLAIYHANDTLLLLANRISFPFCSGLSPFLDDSIEETTANILKCDFCFPDEYFNEISDQVKRLLERLLRLRGEDRTTAEISLSSAWFQVSAQPNAIK